MCVDLRDLNVATLKDIYIMPIVDMLVDATVKNELLSFLNNFSGYNQIFIAPEDVSKTTFKCPDSIRTFEWLVMSFELKKYWYYILESYECHFS